MAVVPTGVVLLLLVRKFLVVSRQIAITINGGAEDNSRVALQQLLQDRGYSLVSQRY